MSPDRKEITGLEYARQHEIVRIGHNRLVNCGIIQVVEPMLEILHPRVKWSDDILEVRLGAVQEKHSLFDLIQTKLLVVHPYKRPNKTRHLWFVDRLPLDSRARELQYPGRFTASPLSGEQAEIITQVAEETSKSPNLDLVGHLKNL